MRDDDCGYEYVNVKYSKVRRYSGIDIATIVIALLASVALCVTIIVQIARLFHGN